VSVVFFFLSKDENLFVRKFRVKKEGGIAIGEKGEGGRGARGRALSARVG
jgi:hypothetical protein